VVVFPMLEQSCLKNLVKSLSLINYCFERFSERFELFYRPDLIIIRVLFVLFRRLIVIILVG
jgi:hypothetical protein